ncbi:hypothetical protein [Escherichia coli]|uniref:hypothetical protein n=1 Tax=Escherichia coli TaxID=562 RepID=UPI00201ACAFB|nr:hypothetical protein [Escherichia coli]
MSTSKNFNTFQMFPSFFDFSDYPLICMTSKNGIGKTSIIKSLALLNDAAIISKTSSIFSINEETKIEITIDEQKFTFESYNNELDTKDILRDDSLLNVELPIPYGRRFSEFPSLGTIDRELRELYLKGEYSSAIDLIEFLNKIYDTSKFQDLKEVIIKGKNIILFLWRTINIYEKITLAQVSSLLSVFLK